MAAVDTTDRLAAVGHQENLDLLLLSVRRVTWEPHTPSATTTVGLGQRDGVPPVDTSPALGCDICYVRSVYQHLLG